MEYEKKTEVMTTVIEDGLFRQIRQAEKNKEKRKMGIHTSYKADRDPDLYYKIISRAVQQLEALGLLKK